MIATFSSVTRVVARAATKVSGATFATPALTQVRRRLADASEEDLAWQQEVIRASIAIQNEGFENLPFVVGEIG